MKHALAPPELQRLRRLLAAHEPWDAAEAAHAETIAAFASRHADPFDRTLVDGHLTGSAFVLDPVGRLLLVHHRRLDLWVQLGGHADGEHAAENVAMREAREESGLEDLSFHPALKFEDGAPRLLDVDVHAIPARGSEPAHDHLDLRFLLVTSSPDRIVADIRETRAIEWVALDEARRRCDAGMRRAFARIERLTSST